MDALTAENLVKEYKAKSKKIRAVDGVGFCVHENEIFGLLGMNGAGKSTTIKMCTGLVKPDSGRCEIYGIDIVKDPTEAKKLVNVSPQETAVAPLLSCRENLVLIARVYGADKADAESRADETLALLKLEDRANDRAGKLSGGLMRRLSIGMALITRPKLVFLDEPTLGLDVVARRELWKIISDMQKRAAIVLTTHYLEEAEALCSRIAVMAHGRIVACGTAEELKAASGESSFENAFLVLSGEETLL